MSENEVEELHRVCDAIVELARSAERDVEVLGNELGELRAAAERRRNDSATEDDMATLENAERELWQMRGDIDRATDTLRGINLQ